MPEIFLYLLKVNIALSLFYLGYYFLLKKLTFYSLNRFYLLLSIVVSAIFPFLQLPSFFSQPDVIYKNVVFIGGSMGNLPQNHGTDDMFWVILLGAYWIVMALGGIKLLVSLLSLYRTHVKSFPQFWNGYTFNNLAIDSTPFSFLTKIYLNFEKHTEEELHTILKHEQVHTRNLHSLDVLLVEIWCIFSWFNPFSWCIKKAIKVNIEFIADNEVIQQGIAQHAYQNSLLHFAIQSQNLPLANQFSFLSLKSRINMMNKKQSSKRQLGKYFLVIPLIISSLFLFGVSKAYKTNGSTEVIFRESSDESKTLVDQDSNRSSKARVHISNIDIDRDSSLSERNPLVVIDGELSNKGFKELETTVPVKDIKSMTIVKGKEATSLYGDKAKDGVIILTTKKVDKTAVEKEKVTLKRIIKKAGGDSTKVTQSARSLAVRERTGVITAEKKPATGTKDSVTMTTETGTLIVKRNVEPSATTIKRNPTEDVQILFNPSDAKSRPLYLINGKELNPSEFNNIDPNHIKSITVYKGESATKIYGNKSVNGVVEIQLK